MPTVLNDLAITLFVAGAGVFVGWLLRSLSTKWMVACEDAGGDDEVRQAREALTQLHDLAAQVAADVGQHSHRVETINEELTAGDVCEPDVVVKAIAKLVRANNQMQQRLVSAEGKLREQAKEIQSQTTAARTDALTGLANRRAFDDEIARRHAEYQRHGRVFSLLMIDVDHFKKFNDTHGHQAGDEVLRGVGRVLRENAREMDLVARYGGEEFSVVFPNSRATDVSHSIERLRKGIENARFHFEGKELRVTVSLGVAHLLLDEDTDSLIQRADAALYASKEAGRNCAHWHDGQAIHPISIGEPAKARKAPGDKPAPDPQPPEKAPPQTAQEKPETKQQEVQPAAKKPAAKKPGAGGQVGISVPALHNRTEFCIVTSRRLAEWKRGGPIPSVLLVQVDRLSEIVTQHGHQTGNFVLKATSQFLTAAIRDMDLAAHYDDTTFAILLPETNLVGAADVAERLKQAIAHCKLPIGDKEIEITVSTGGAEATERDDVQKLLGRAEEALAVATKSGGNRAWFHNGTACVGVDAVDARLAARG